MRCVVICAGGPETEIADLTAYRNADAIFIGADRGAFHLLQRGIEPHEAVGDFDSVSEIEYQEIIDSIPIVDQFQAEKNETDTELAVERAILYNPEKVILTGLTGGRLDHTESALHLLYRFQVKYPHILFSICNPLNELRILSPGVYKLSKDKQLQFVSFFSFGDKVSGLTLRGFKYEVTDELLETGTTRFTSNELAEGVCTISFHEGICLMVRSSDA
ncbi:thiamine diphosphokinase [Sporosarcina sp. CAU 1771]